MPRPKYTLEDLPEGYEPYVPARLVCLAFGFKDNYLRELKKDPEFPFITIPGGEARFRLSAVEDYLKRKGEEERQRKLPEQQERAALARRSVKRKEGP